MNEWMCGCVCGWTMCREKAQKLLHILETNETHIPEDVFKARLLATGELFVDLKLFEDGELAFRKYLGVVAASDAAAITADAAVESGTQSGKRRGDTGDTAGGSTSGTSSAAGGGGAGRGDGDTRTFKGES